MSQDFSDEEPRDRPVDGCSVFHHGVVVVVVVVVIVIEFLFL